MDKKQLEKYSSAITLSDMEIFVFPQLMYSLVLANIMSPIIWKWRQNEVFKKLKNKSTYRTLMRMKQFIMDEYEFNLDLETWGLTNQKNELKRFAGIIEPKDIADSNALFGYHGDEYYFDVDIRRHFGLDKYDSDIIPYWKTETIEAMTAFKLKENYSRGAGECVSLAALYAAASFIAAQIPLEDIHMILTPLHSQNFINVKDGVLTNNRRLVTKNMWFNGSALSSKAQRALKNEQVTIVANNTGWIHCMYDNATINQKSYKKFTNQLTEYLNAELDEVIFANFLRCHRKFQKYFQFCAERRNEPMFIKAEVLYHYEHSSSYRIGMPSYDKLLEEVDEEDYTPGKHTNRICCNQLIGFLQYENIDLKKSTDREKLKNYLKNSINEAEDFVKHLLNFIHLEPKLPSPQKKYNSSEPLALTVDMERQDVIDYLSSIRNKNEMADLAFYAYRDMKTCKWQPFIKAALERNPVSLEKTNGKSPSQVYDWLNRLTSNSIYDKHRLAQPDEVINYATGDGLEKAFLLANVIKSQKPDQKITLEVSNNNVNLKADKQYSFQSDKELDNKVEM